MLYKKYHRNFVRQFKKGAKFKCSYYKQPDIVCDVDVEPYYDGRFWRRNIRITGSNTGTKYNFVLVHSGGQLSDVNVV